MAQLKTQKNDASVENFLNSVEHNVRREDSFEVLKLMQEITGEPAEMWGDSIVGFGSFHYKYASGHQGDWMLVGFAPRKQNLALYLMDGFDDYEEMLGKLGKHKTGKSCLYINKLADVDMNVLRDMVARSVEHMRDPQNRMTHSE